MSKYSFSTKQATGSKVVLRKVTRSGLPGTVNKILQPLPPQPSQHPSKNVSDMDVDPTEEDLPNPLNYNSDPMYARFDSPGPTPSHPRPSRVCYQYDLASP